MGFRPKFIDIVLFAAIAYAITDTINNSDVYQKLSYPFSLNIILSVVTLIVFRCTHYFGLIISGEYERAEDQRPGNLPPPVTFNWS
jgi:hypothetical protein